jgi:hypothetical protein
VPDRLLVNFFYAQQLGHTARRCTTASATTPPTRRDASAIWSLDGVHLAYV